MLCEDAGILEETLQAIKDLNLLHIRRLGDRALLVPADQISAILEMLQREGIFPHVSGTLIKSSSDTQDEPIAEEAL